MDGAGGGDSVITGGEGVLILANDIGGGAAPLLSSPGPDLSRDPALLFCGGGESDLSLRDLK